MHFTNLVVNASVKQHAFRGGRFARINMRGYTDVAISI
jgi:hypothetical protein